MSYFQQFQKAKPEAFDQFLEDLDRIAREALKREGWSTWYNDNNYIPPSANTPDYAGHTTAQALLCVLAKAEDWAELSKRHGRTPIEFAGRQMHL